MNNVESYFGATTSSSLVRPPFTGASRAPYNNASKGRGRFGAPEKKTKDVPIDELRGSRA